MSRQARYSTTMPHRFSRYSISGAPEARFSKFSTTLKERLPESLYETQRASGLRFNDVFLQLFCEKNSDGTKTLKFSGNVLRQRFEDSLFPADVIHICNFLKNHPEVNSVDLSYNPIEDEGMEILCHMTLKHPNSIEHLNLTHCNIGHMGMKVFYFVAQGGFITLKTLRVTGNTDIGRQGGYLIALSIPHIPPLEYLDVGDTNQAVDSLATIFEKTSYYPLKVLNVSRPTPPHYLLEVDYTKLAEDISEMFQLNQTLVELHVQKCELDAHCVESMLKGLQRNTSLKFLDIGYNNICCVGVEFLSEWLKTRPNLTGLNIAGNNVKNHGGVALSFGMPFSKLRYLDISDNHIGNKGIIAILKSIKKPYMLRYFMLWGNDFSHPANEIIQRMMRSKVFEQDGIDVKIYCVDDVLYAARYTIDRYKHRYYSVTDYGCAVELKIKKNKVPQPNDKPRALVDFKHIDRYPLVKLPTRDELLQEKRLKERKQK